MRCPTFCCNSATMLSTSRPRTLKPSVMRRWVLSRWIWLGAFHDAHLRNLTERNLLGCPLGPGAWSRTRSVHRPRSAVCRRQAHHQIKPFLALENLPRRLPGESRVDNPVHIGYIQSEFGDLRPVEFDKDLRQPAHLLDVQVFGSVDGAHDAANAFGSGRQIDPDPRRRFSGLRPGGHRSSAR